MLRPSGASVGWKQPVLEATPDEREADKLVRGVAHIGCPKLDEAAEWPQIADQTVWLLDYDGPPASDVGTAYD